MTESNNSDMSCTCILGPSGTGKTTLAKHLTKNTGAKNTFIVNGSGEYSEGEYKEISWDETAKESLNDCNLIFEDLIGTSNKQCKVIKEFLHYFIRRKKIHLFLLAHEVHNTGISTYLGSMDKIYITSGPKSEKILRDLPRLIKYEEDFDKDFFLTQEHHYLAIDSKTRKVAILNSTFQNAQSEEDLDKAKKRREVALHLGCLPDGKTLLRLFDIIFKNLSTSYLTDDDLCLMVYTDQSNYDKVHIVDFLYYLRSKKQPPKHIEKLKQFIDEKFVIPNLLIKNPYLKSHSFNS